MTFNLATNGACNNSAFSAGTILWMHETAERLYLIAKAMAGITSPSSLAKRLNESPQNINNWEGARGVSAVGALKAQREFGCDANWLLTGDGPVLGGWPFSAELLATVRKLRQPELLQAENVLRSHLAHHGLAQLSELTPATVLLGKPIVAGARQTLQLSHDSARSSGYSDPADDQLLATEASTPVKGKKKHASKTDQRTPRPEGGGGA